LLAGKVVGIAFRNAKQIPHHLGLVSCKAADLFHKNMIVMKKNIQPMANGRGPASIAPAHATRVL
jgi:hypothetical protein